MTAHPPRRRLLITSLFGLLISPLALALDTRCQLQYPVVLSHNWGMQRICKAPTSSEGTPCEQFEDFARYCADKATHPDGSPWCKLWQVPDDEADLPPRDRNVADAGLTRQLRGHYRYFSRPIVDRLSQTCGNRVYIADKPPYATNAVRARSLRGTVLQALRETGAPKVILIGLSQGVQDARYMSAVLPVDDADPLGERMASRVAAVVSLSGEDGGAEAASLQLDAIYISTLGRWSDQAKAYGDWNNADVDAGLWKRSGDPDGPRALIEGCRGSDECAISTVDQRYRWYLRSVTDITTAYMRPDLTQRLGVLGPMWSSLRQFIGKTERHWEEVVPPRLEAASTGVRYFSYAAGLRQWSDGLEFPEVYWAITLTAGMNDGFVSVDRQRFQRPGMASEHIRTLNGQYGGSGYHHMFFSGRNDALFAPRPTLRESAPYQGSSADFFQQMAMDLRQRGL